MINYMKQIKKLVLASTLIIMPHLVQATPQLVGTETLGGITGINGVTVNGSLYDVTFIDGSFDTLYAVDPSIVYTPEFSTAGTQALFDLFTGTGALQGSSLDYHPEFAFGVTDAALTRYATIYGIQTLFPRVDINQFNNYAQIDDSIDGITGATWQTKSVNSITRVYLKWQAVPEPTAIGLLASGLLGWTAYQYHKRKAAVKKR
jgi:hypothetical protein